MATDNGRPALMAGSQERVMSHPDIFAWSGGEIVLFIEYRDGTWIVARGWRRADELRYVRRWAFDAPARAVGQLRRLVRDACGDSEAAAGAATRWLDMVWQDEESAASERR